MIGTFLVQKRLSLIGDGIGHVAFAGVGAGLLPGSGRCGRRSRSPSSGAIGVEWLRMRRKASGDLALALFFYYGHRARRGASRAAAGDFDVEALSYLFGEPLTVDGGGDRVDPRDRRGVVAAVVCCGGCCSRS